MHYDHECWICRKPLPPEEQLKQLDEYGFTVHGACFSQLTAEKNTVKVPTNT
jgi:hypothetical protein